MTDRGRFLSIWFLCLGIACLVQAGWADADEETGDCEFTAVKLGRLTDEGKEINPGQELRDALLSNPDCRVVAVDYLGFQDPLVGNERKRLFYDRREMILIDLSRFSGEKGIVSYHWRIWYDSWPQEFENGIPYDIEGEHTKRSPRDNPMEALHKEYRGPAEATLW